MNAMPEADTLNGSFPVLSCAAALEFERELLAGDEAREWAAMSRAGLGHVLFTRVMAWHEVQPSPACASGVSICSRMGRSKRPLKKTA